MSEIAKDVGKVWDRLFDQKGYLNGEIIFALQEFEEKRGDAEIDLLFKSIENITNIKDTQINRLNEIASENIIVANQQLSESLKLVGQFACLEEKYTENTELEESRNKRKEQWEKIMDGITSQYSRINAEFEEKEKETTEYFKNLELNLK